MTRNEFEGIKKFYDEEVEIIAEYQNKENTSDYAKVRLEDGTETLFCISFWEEVEESDYSDLVEIEHEILD